MWNGFISYFTTSSLESQQPTISTDSDTNESNDWVFVNNSGQEITKEVADHETKLDDDHESHKSLRLSPLPLLDIENKENSPGDSPSLSPSKTEDGWYITPPPCFTVNCPTQLEISPLEDLLIEHPSMSVYQSLPYSSLKLFTPPQSDILETAECEEDPTADCPILAFPELVKIPKMPRNTIPKNVALNKSYELKDIVNKIENRKPSQQAKYRKEQYKLRPSFMRRQNMVQNCKNVFNSKNKCVVKPFGEKCKRSF